MLTMVYTSTGVNVASLAEAWIEMIRCQMDNPMLRVASLAEAWIEIYYWDGCEQANESPPSRRRGLKWR